MSHTLRNDVQFCKEAYRCCTPIWNRIGAQKEWTSNQITPSKKDLCGVKSFGTVPAIVLVWDSRVREHRSGVPARGYVDICLTVAGFGRGWNKSSYVLPTRLMETVVDSASAGVTAIRIIWSKQETLVCSNDAATPSAVLLGPSLFGVQTAPSNVQPLLVSLTLSELSISTLYLEKSRPLFVDDCQRSTRAIQQWRLHRFSAWYQLPYRCLKQRSSRRFTRRKLCSSVNSL